MLGDRKSRRYQRPKRDLSHITVDGVGPVPCDYMLIAERPGKQEVSALHPAPLIGVSGTEMDRYLAAGNLHRDSFFITNMVRDFRDGKNPDDWEIARDECFIREELDMVQPCIIGAMGRFSTRFFLGSVDMEMVHGIPHFVGDSPVGPITVLPIMHPAAGFYNSDTQPLILADFKMLGNVIHGLVEPRFPDVYAIFETEHNPDRWLNPFETNIAALDTEGWLRAPWGLSVSIRDGYGTVVKAGEPNLARVNYNIQSACDRNSDFTVYLHNSLHDLPILERLGIHIPPTRFRDTMILAYLLCVEPQGLKPLAYRHCNMRMRSYEEVVGPYYSAVFEEYIRSAACVPDLPEYEQDYVILVNGQAKLKRPWGIARHLRKILKDADKAVSAGIDFDFSKRWEKIDDYKKHKVINTIGDPPEYSLEYVPEDEAVPYSGCDAVATYRIAPILERRIKEQGLETVAAIDHAVVPMFDRMQRIGITADPEYFDRLAIECTESMLVVQEKLHVLTGCLINPDSGDQVAELLFDNMHLEREVNFELARTEDGDRISTNDKVLEALRFVNDAVGMVCDYREISKIRSSYCWPIARYARLTPDHRIHPNFRLTRVSSGRPSCTKPNLLAIPVRSDLGKRVRAGLVAAPGHVLYDIDLSQVEMRYMADESEDASLIHDFDHNIDVHDSTGANISGYQLDVYCADKKIRSKWRDPAKRVNFGVITQITKHGLVAQMRLANATKNGIPLAQGGQPWEESDCDRMLADYFDHRVGVRRYIDNCRAEARRYSQVRDRWGRIRLLPGVHSTIKWVAEEALRAASSFKIQAGAAGVMKQGQAQVWNVIQQLQSEGIYCEPLLQVYDELLIEVDDRPDIRELLDYLAVDALTHTCELPFVKLGAKGDFGYNWMQAKG